ncbi:hypothetical protein AAG906_019793 [Vitis piasezkii]|uniref:Uncharacterized protein n=1 Tax=Vitis vinifera TaxID=29760 RepID=D7SXD8_VITVI
MGRSCFLRALFLSALLLLSSSHGFGRKAMESFELKDSSTVLVKESAGKARVMIQMMDYEEPVPNTNPKSGYYLSPPPQG